MPWPEFIKTSSEADIQSRFSQEAKAIMKEASSLGSYCYLGLLDPERSISSFDSDLLYAALKDVNSQREKDILLFILSPGGSIEPAYQISKLCRAFAKERFIVAVPREAKSAATLLALGADEIHMGPLSQLGPIDPQLGGLPALGVVQALETLASLSEKHPGSAEMFARYLRMALTVEQIGYCERISESAVQYAERLLATKPHLASIASQVARELVYEYKNHRFVIDATEAQAHLGAEWIRTETRELEVAERIYNLYDEVNLFLGIFRSKRLLVVGRLDSGVMIFDKPEK